MNLDVSPNKVQNKLSALCHAESLNANAYVRNCLHKIYIPPGVCDWEEKGGVVENMYLLEWNRA
jgi:hypothetical protein